jgi:hypothetical protein
MDNFPTAASMRELMDSALPLASRTQVLDIHTRIHNAVAQGRSNVTVNAFQPGVQAFLEAKGYKVMYCHSIPLDPSYWVVSW